MDFVAYVLSRIYAEQNTEKTRSEAIEKRDTIIENENAWKAQQNFIIAMSTALGVLAVAFIVVVVYAGYRIKPSGSTGPDEKVRVDENSINMMSYHPYVCLLLRNRIQRQQNVHIGKL